MTSGPVPGRGNGASAGQRPEPREPVELREREPGEPAVVVEGLTKRYGDRTVVDDVSLSIAAGELLAILGPNGAGKTTTVEIIEGYRRADAGRVRVLGSDPATGGPSLRARVGLMLQDGGVDPRAQPLETIRQYGRFHRDPRDADELVDLVGLRAVARTRYRRLSGGERQRLGLALALVGRPEVVILDEPTAGMDPEARVATRGIVSDLRDAGAAILLTSHDLTDVERLADRICILDEGRIVATGTATELAGAIEPKLRFRVDRPFVPTELEALGRSLAAGRPGVTVVPEPDGARYRIEGARPDAALVAALAGWCATADRLIVELRTAGGTLEETYLALLGADGAAGGEA